MVATLMEQHYAAGCYSERISRYRASAAAVLKIFYRISTTHNRKQHDLPKKHETTTQRKSQELGMFERCGNVILP
jgi:hypothetical protein